MMTLHQKGNGFAGLNEKVRRDCDADEVREGVGKSCVEGGDERGWRVLLGWCGPGGVGFEEYREVGHGVSVEGRVAERKGLGGIYRTSGGWVEQCFVVVNARCGVR